MMMGCSLPPLQDVLCIAVLVVGVFAVTVKPEEEQDASRLTTCELNLAQLLLMPPDSMQVQALRRELYHTLELKLGDDEYTKRSLASLVRDGKLPYLPKRNLEGDYLTSSEDIDADDFKRSIANLAKNGQLPTFQKSDDDHSKRGIESLARNGELHGKRVMDNLLTDLYDKRNIGSLARGFNFPVAGKRYIGALARTGGLNRYIRADDDIYDKRNIASIVRQNGKRNMASLVRSNNLPGGKRYYLFDELKRNLASIARTMGSKYNGKRAVPTAALLRQDSYMAGSDSKHFDDDTQLTKNDNENETSENDTVEKRNIAALKAQMKPKYKREAQDVDAVARSKRQADYWEANEEYPSPVYQNNNGYDYEELIHALTGEYPSTDKRFLGRIPQMGRPKTTPSSRMNP